MGENEAKMNNCSDFLKHALNLARRRLGFSAPNPAVGAVVVKDNKIIGEGAHFGAGHPHAEVNALKGLKEQAKGADLYVTLEPCCHYGRTPPCTELIVSTGIARVFFGFKDPNPVVGGKGQAFLRSQGVVCEHLPLIEINAFYRPYLFWVQEHRPFVTLKIAITRDGYIAGPHKNPILITDKACNRLTHEKRLMHDAIITTAETIICDDPSFNVRLGNDTYKKPLYVLDSFCRLPSDAKVFQTALSITVFYHKKADPEEVARLTRLGARCIPVSKNHHGLDLTEALSIIGQQAHSLWVEVGAQCTKSFLESGLCQEVIVYQSSKKIVTEGYSFRGIFQRIDSAGYVLSEDVWLGSDHVFYFSSLFFTPS